MWCGIWTRTWQQPRRGDEKGFKIKLESMFIILISRNLDTEPAKERQSRNFLLVLGNYVHGQDFSDFIPALSTMLWLRFCVFKAYLFYYLTRTNLMWKSSGILVRLMRYLLGSGCGLCFGGRNWILWIRFIANKSISFLASNSPIHVLLPMPKGINLSFLINLNKMRCFKMSRI